MVIIPSLKNAFYMLSFIGKSPHPRFARCLVLNFCETSLMICIRNYQRFHHAYFVALWGRKRLWPVSPCLCVVDLTFRQELKEVHDPPGRCHLESGAL